MSDWMQVRSDVPRLLSRASPAEERPRKQLGPSAGLGVAATFETHPPDFWKHQWTA